MSTNLESSSIASRFSVGLCFFFFLRWDLTIESACFEAACFRRADNQLSTDVSLTKLPENCFCFHKLSIKTLTARTYSSATSLIFASLPISNLALYVSHREFYGYGATDKERHSVFPDYDILPENSLEFTKSLIEKDR